MRERALIHVAGPEGAGKTTFIERLFEAEVAFATCVRGERDAKLRKAREAAPKANAELRRYREAGASAVALYRFAEPSMDAFFMSKVMEDYSEAVFIEGDCPIEYVDLAVFVAPVPPKGRSLLHRVTRDHAAAHLASLGQLARTLESPAAMARLLGAEVGEPFAARALQQPRVLDELRRSMKPTLRQARRARTPAATEHWALEERYEGIERAELVVVNVHGQAERAAAEALVEQVARLRNDEQVYRDVMGRGSNKVPITAVVADLLDPKDAGLRKAVARVKRAAKRRSP
jgi:hypothetical protein